MVDVVREIQTAIRTGKVMLGSRRTIKAMVNGEAKLVIVVSNTPPHIKRDIEWYCKVAGTPVYKFPGTSWELGSACNKPFMVAALAIIDPGESGVLELARGG